MVGIHVFLIGLLAALIGQGTFASAKVPAAPYKAGYQRYMLSYKQLRSLDRQAQHDYLRGVAEAMVKLSKAYALAKKEKEKTALFEALQALMGQYAHAETLQGIYGGVPITGTEESTGVRKYAGFECGKNHRGEIRRHYEYDSQYEICNPIIFGVNALDKTPVCHRTASTKWCFENTRLGTLQTLDPVFEMLDSPNYQGPGWDELARTANQTCNNLKNDGGSMFDDVVEGLKAAIDACDLMQRQMKYNMNPENKAKRNLLGDKRTYDPPSKVWFSTRNKPTATADQTGSPGQTNPGPHARPAAAQPHRSASSSDSTGSISEAVSPPPASGPGPRLNYTRLSSDAQTSKNNTDTRADQSSGVGPSRQRDSAVSQTQAQNRPQASGTDEVPNHGAPPPRLRLKVQNAPQVTTTGSSADYLKYKDKEYAMIDGNGVNFRADPSQDSRSLGKLYSERNDSIILTGQYHRDSEGYIWKQGTYHNITGWVREDLLSDTRRIKLHGGSSQTASRETEGDPNLGCTDCEVPQPLVDDGIRQLYGAVNPPVVSQYPFPHKPDGSGFCTVSSRMGRRNLPGSRDHEGIDIVTGKRRIPVHAPVGGIIIGQGVRGNFGGQVIMLHVPMHMAPRVRQELQAAGVMRGSMKERHQKLRSFLRTRKLDLTIDNGREYVERQNLACLYSHLDLLGDPYQLGSPHSVGDIIEAGSPIGRTATPRSTYGGTSTGHHLDMRCEAIGDSNCTYPADMEDFGPWCQPEDLLPALPSRRRGPTEDEIDELRKIMPDEEIRQGGAYRC